jgi:hypothetical protein
MAGREKRVVPCNSVQPLGQDGKVMQGPPRDSASGIQAAMAARLRADLAATLVDFLARIREELAYNSVKGGGAYRQGMHDGLKFAEDSLADILREYASDVLQMQGPAVDDPLDIAPEFWGGNFWRDRDPEDSTRQASSV